MNQVASANPSVVPTTGKIAPKRPLNLFSAPLLAPTKIVKYTLDELSAFATAFAADYAAKVAAHVAKAKALSGDDAAEIDHPKPKQVLFFGVTYASVCGQTHASRMARLSDYDYVFKILMRMSLVRWECVRMAARDDNNERINIYSSEYAQNMVRERQAKQEKYLERCNIINMRTGQAFNMLDLYKTKKRARRSETYGLIKDVERCADDVGYQWMFVTWTCPGQFHIAPETKNPEVYWDKVSTPHDSARFVQSIYQAGTDDIRRKGINYFGCWSKEPHKSSCVHMHGLIFAHPSDFEEIEKRLVRASRNAIEATGSKFYQDQAIKIIRQMSDSELADQYAKDLAQYVADKQAGKKGIKRPRLKKAANPASYIFKYILKSIGDTAKDNGIDHAEAQQAHAQVHRYRRFDFFGIKQCLTKWRLVRSLLRHPAYEKDQSEAFDAVRNNNFMTFASLVDDIELIKITSISAGRYGDRSDIVVGIRYQGREYHRDEYLMEVRYSDGVVYPDCKVQYL